MNELCAAMNVSRVFIGRKFLSSVTGFQALYSDICASGFFESWTIFGDNAPSSRGMLCSGRFQNSSIAIISVTGVRMTAALLI